MRGRPITDADVTRWLVLLGFTVEYIRQKLQANNLQEKVRRWNEMKEDIRKQWRKIAFELHPDRNGGDDKKFKDVKEVYDILQSISLMVGPPPMRRPPMQPRVVHIHIGFSSGGFSSTASTAGNTANAFYSSFNF